MFSKRSSWGHLAVCVLAVAMLHVTPSAGNSMDPHVYPSRGPFFEGWYLRLIDHNQNASFGFLFGLVLPSPNQNLRSKPGLAAMNADKKPLLCASLLLNPEEGSKLASPTGCFDPKDYSVLEDGKPVKRNPDDKTPPAFEVKLASNLSFVVNGTGSSFSVTIGDHKLEGRTTAPVAWGPRGEGPESWLERLPLPIHWFVYSLRSTVLNYNYTNMATAKVVNGGSQPGKLPVVAHMEKNWGKSFPIAWVWAEGVNPANNVSFALSAGRLHEFSLNIPAQLTGYRNPGKDIRCSFHPVNSVHTLKHDGCAGTATLDVKSLHCHVVIELSASLESFSSCLVTPQTDGFERGCYESYEATATITVQEFLKGVTDRQVIPLSALEFGGTFMCNGKCPKS